MRRVAFLRFIGGPGPLGLALTVFTMTACRGGCGREGQGRATAEGAFALFPAEARTVVSIDFRAIRQTVLWQRLSGLAAADPQDRKLIADFTARTGLDPFAHVHRVTAAFPDDARATGRFGLLIEGEGLDEKRLLTYARDQARLRGADIKQRDHEGRRLWAGDDPAGPAAFFLDAGRVVIAGGPWADRMAALADGDGPSAAGEGDRMLVRLVDRVGAGRALWLATVVPQETRSRLRGDPLALFQASVMRLAAAADLGPGLTADVIAELSNANDARTYATKVEAFLRDAKRNPQVLLLGAGPYLDAVSVEAQGPNVRIRVVLDEKQTSELIGRLVGLARLSRR